MVLTLDLGWDALRGAIDDASVLHKSLDHPVTFAWAMDTGVDTGRTQVVVATVAHAAVEVVIVHGVVAVVAVYHPRRAGTGRRLEAEREVSIKACGCTVVEECC